LPVRSPKKQDGCEAKGKTKMARYAALVDGKKGAYGVVIPDLPGCTAMGKTVDEALRNAAGAAVAWATVAKADGVKIPRPRAIEVLRRDPEVADALAEGAVIAMVPLVLDTGRPAKANLSLDAGLLEAIDEAAASKGLTRSAFIASAAREKIVADA
jgi:predicted RNase H-like HicB family nuclease